MVWPTRVRHRKPKHAFEDALDEAQLHVDEDGYLLDQVAALNAPLGPAVGSIGDIAVAAGYVASTSLAQAYGAEGEPVEVRLPAAEPPAVAACKLKEALQARAHTPGELRRLRRNFASEHHPDRLAPELRDEAVAAMAEVNAAIDSELKRAGI